MVLTNRSILTPWLIRHCGWLHSRFQKHTDGKTSFERVKGHAYHGMIVEFGECVSGRKAGPITAKMEPHFVTGVWIGKTTGSDEHMIASANGIFPTRTIRRREENTRFDVSVVRQVYGVPWDLQYRPGNASREPPVPPPPAPVSRDLGFTAREQSLRLFWREWGKTPHCKACHEGAHGNTHSAECRRRRQQWEDSKQSAAQRAEGQPPPGAPQEPETSEGADRRVRFRSKGLPPAAIPGQSSNSSNGNPGQSSGSHSGGTKRQAEVRAEDLDQERSERENAQQGEKRKADGEHPEDPGSATMAAIRPIL
eukprot:5003230-Pyramimonas_sp.AAC.1